MRKAQIHIDHTFIQVLMFVIFSNLCLTVQTPSAGEKILWQVGVVDSLYHEFGQSVFSGGRMNHFTIGKDASSGKWNATLPAVPREEQDKALTQEIEFNVSDLKTGNYELTLNCIFRLPLIPHLRIEVNEHPGHYAFTPRRISRVKDSNSRYTYNFSFESAVISIPSAFLKQGNNTIKFTAHTEPSLPLDSLRWEKDKLPGGAYKSGAIYWDALMFSEPASIEQNVPPYEVNINPTYFYVQQKGKPYEWMIANIVLHKSAADGSLSLSAGGEKIIKKITAQYEFGRIQIPFLLPADGQAVQVTWELESSGDHFSKGIEVKTAKKWTLFAAPRAHLDVGYTEGQSASLDVHNFSLDRAMAIIEKYSAYRWNIEGTTVIDEYRQNHNDQQFGKLLQYLKDGKIGTNSLSATPLSEFASLEELFRSNYRAMSLREKYGIPVKVTTITDVPTATMAIPDVLSHMDIPYLVISANPTRSRPVDYLVGWDKQSPMLWKGLGGGTVTLQYTDHFAHIPYYLGYPNDIQVACDQLPLFLDYYNVPEFTLDALLLYGLRNDNNFIGYNGDADFLTKWNEWFAYPKIIISTDEKYFEYIASRFPSNPKTLRGDGGAYWEDGVGSSIRETIIARRAKYRLTDAEKLLSLTAPFYREVSYPAERIQKVWNDIILYTEHTWGSHFSVRDPHSTDAQNQWAFKRAFARNAEVGTNSLLESGFKQLEGVLNVPVNSALVFNSSNWTRSDWVEIEINKGYWLVDKETGTPVSGEVVNYSKELIRIRFLAENVPSLGVKIYSVERQSLPLKDNQKVPGNKIETPYYRIELDQKNENIISIIDRETGQELIDPASAHKMNQYLYVMGGEERRIVTHTMEAPMADLKIAGSYPVLPAVLEKTPVGWQISFSQKAPYTPSIGSVWRLYEKMKRIDITNCFSKEEVDRVEAVYIAFPFMFTRPNVCFDIQTGWLNPRKDLIKGACNEWFNLQYGALLSDEAKEVLLSSPDIPLVSFGDIVRGKWGDTFRMENGSVFSYVLNNYWFTNYQWLQSGEYSLRYSLISGKKIDPDVRLRQAMEAAHPLTGYTVNQVHLLPEKGPGNDKRYSHSLIKIYPESVYCEVIKGAEDGRGIIVRLLNFADREVSGTLSSNVFRITGASECRGDERDVKNLSVSEGAVNYNLGKHKLATLRVVVEVE